MAGHAGTSLPRRLGIEDRTVVALVRAPEGFAKSLEPLPDGVRLRTQARGMVDVLVFFVTRRAELERRLPVLARKVVPEGGLWIAWPKRASGVATDLRESVVRQVGVAAGLVDNKVCAVDDTWSGLRFVSRLADRPARGR